MLWHCTLRLALLDYRLIAINVLIYDLIASEIVNVNAHIVMATTGMTEFDKSAAMQTTDATTTTKVAGEGSEEQQRDASKFSISRRSTAGMSNDDDPAELAHFAHKPMRGSGEAGGNNNLSTRNIRFALMANENSNNYASDQQIAAARPFDMIGVMMTMTMTMTMTDNCSRFTNIHINVMPTINESVDNFRNDKRQIASAAVVGQNNMKAVTGVLVTTARTAAAATTMAAKEPATTKAAKVKAVARQSAIKAKVITAIKSAATQFTALTAAAPATREAALTSTAVAATPTLPAVSTHGTTAGPAPRTSTSKASTTMSKLPITTTSTPTTTRAAPWWPALHGHDLLSPTNGMPNCRVTSVMFACVEKCQATTNNNATPPTTATSMAFVKPSEAIKSSATATATAASSPSSSLPSSPTTSALTTKMQEAPTTAAKATTTTTTAKIHAATTNANQQSWSTTHVTSAGGVKLSPSTNENNSMTFKAYSNKTKFATTTIITTTPKREKIPSKHQAGRTFPVPAAPVESTPSTRPTNLTSTLATATTTTTSNIVTTSTKSAIAKSTSTLQLHWQRILSRRKRYLAFPEGASFSHGLQRTRLCAACALRKSSIFYAQ
ncbi:mucin-5AC isoform X2 [Rhagoletis pomonella]|uniref:mucin-5AC isoform X2 n=1 Tax=Rhagoletis pomonella TaxID=28610 RepID=UPI00177B5CA6|nr:mucin-5AC isoform X2 [Rhagoletis pomonella]